MTLLHSPDDELISAYIDGTGAEADAAHIESCAVCLARVAEMRRVAARVASPIGTPDPVRRDHAIAAALAAGATAGRRRVTAAVQRLRHPLVPLIVVAIALVGLVSFLVFGPEESPDTDIRGREEVLTTELGRIDDMGVLGERLEAGLETARLGSATGDDNATAPLASFPCEVEAQSALDGEARLPLLSAHLEWRGRPAVVHVYEGEEGPEVTRRAVVLSADRCELLARRTL